MIRTSIIRFLGSILLASLCISACSKSITAIGNFEGQWGGTFVLTRAYGVYTGAMTIDVQKDRTFSGEGFIHVDGNFGGASLYVDFSGDVFPNGALIGKCHWRAYGFGFGLPDSGTTKIQGAINPAEDYGTGTIRISDTVLQWFVYRIGK